VRHTHVVHVLGGEMQNIFVVTVLLILLYQYAEKNA